MRATSVPTLTTPLSSWALQLPPSDPVSAISFLMDQMNLTRKDLEPLLGPKSRVSDVLNKKRDLTLAQIVRLHRRFQIPYESLIDEKRYS